MLVARKRSQWPGRVKSKSGRRRPGRSFEECLDAVGQVYASNIYAIETAWSVGPSLTLSSLRNHSAGHSENEVERARVRARVYAGLGNEYYWQAELSLGQEDTIRRPKEETLGCSSIYMKRSYSFYR